MRMLKSAVFVAATLALTTTAVQAAPANKAHAAASADSFAVNASYRTNISAKGYSAQSRRLADCLTTYPGAYDPKTDRVFVRPGVMKRCTL